MGTRWDSVLFTAADATYADLAASLTQVARRCARVPKIMVHFFSRDAVTSVEMTQFLRRQLRLADGEASDLSARVFGGAASFSGPEVLVAQHVSAILGSRTVYLHVNDSYNSVGYVAFAAGEVAEFETVNWQGSTTQFADRPRAPSDRNDVIRRGTATVGGSLRVDEPEDLFRFFYESPTTLASFAIIDRGAVLSPPLRES